jgi:predicted 2-oxoglutarate/Fe(II)-dependent dioxygenase YbiX
VPFADFFSHLGLFVAKGFFDTDVCRQLRTEMRTVQHVPATIVRDSAHVINEDAYVINEDARKTDLAQVSTSTSSFVKDRLLELKPVVASHFNLSLTGCQAPKLLVYKSGYFFGPHIDQAPGADVPELERVRQVSVVIFLNGEADEPQPGSYCGGALTFYGLFDQPPWHCMGLPLVGEEGLLVAFPPDLRHEVKPITYGERYTVAGWFV